ncbi:MAG: cell division protein FtsQ/DivIB [Leptothrix sp. (in: b-proteobacteria)]
MATTSTMPAPTDVRLMRAGANALLALTLLAVVGVALVWLVQLPLFSFSQISIEGEVQHTSDLSVRMHALPRLVGGYFTMDLKKTRAAFEAVPWVRRALVRRVWPNRLVVELEEHHPVAYWERDAGDDLMVNQQGEVFEVNLGDVDDDNLPTLRGPQGSAPLVLDMLQRLTPVFRPLGASIDKLALSERGSWRLTLDGGTVLELGRGQPGEVLQRTQRFAGTVTQITSRFGHHQVEYADLRHNEGYALRLIGMGTVDSAKAGAKGR